MQKDLRKLNNRDLIQSTWTKPFFLDFFDALKVQAISPNTGLAAMQDRGAGVGPEGAQRAGQRDELEPDAGDDHGRAEQREHLRPRIRQGKFIKIL